MAPNFVFGCTGPSGEEICFTEHFTPRAQAAASQSDKSIFALDSITRGVLSPLTPILNQGETFLANEYLYLHASKYGGLAPQKYARGEATYSDLKREAFEAGVADTSMWQLPTQQDDLQALAKLQDQMQKSTKYDVKPQQKQHWTWLYDNADISQPPKAPAAASQLFATGGGTKAGDDSCNTPLPIPWADPSATCAAVGSFDCADPSDPVRQEFMRRGCDLGISPEKSYAACVQAQRSCQGCGAAPATNVPFTGPKTCPRNPNVNPYGPSPYGPSRNPYGPYGPNSNPYPYGPTPTPDNCPSYYDNRGWAQNQNPYYDNDYYNDSSLGF